MKFYYFFSGAFSAAMYAFYNIQDYKMTFAFALLSLLLWLRGDSLYARNKTN